jgi:hypothetical protein
VRVGEDDIRELSPQRHSIVSVVGFDFIPSA